VPPGTLVQGYGPEQPEPAMLMDSAAGERYVDRREFTLAVPKKDLAFAKEMARRMGWELHEK
jgi:hypothetical protein